ncbi:MAG: helix-turn-helix domain-containing protein [Alistipes sp.]|nr:helix-turn-helix domain-containing protein [Alistipes sp.]
MDVVIIDRGAFDKMMSSLEIAVKKIDEVSNRYSKKKEMQNWLEGDEVRAILNVTKRTLQTYRSNGMLPYTQIGYKVYYLAKDIQNLIDNQKLEG